MFANYLTSTFRYLWRHRLFTALNILGLAISISICWVIYRIVDYDFSYEKALTNRDKIYRVVTGFVFDEKEQYNGGVSKPLYQGIREQAAGLDCVVPVFGQSIQLVAINTSNTKPLTVEDQTDIVATDSAYFYMLPYQWLAGNKSTAFAAPNSVVLTEERAKKYFPGKTPKEIFQKTITYYSRRDTIQRTVTGIVSAGFGAPTEFTAQEFISLPTKAYELPQWANTNGSDKLYLQLNDKADTANLVKQIGAIALQKGSQFEKEKNDNTTYKQWYELMPLKESHFSTYISEWSGNSPLRKADKKFLFALMGIAAFILLLACINYINMSVAAIPQRAKEIGVRKTLGSSKFNLVMQFLSETFFTTILAGIFSYFLSSLGFFILKGIIPPGVTPYTNIWQLLTFIVVFAIAVMLLAGLYPGWLATKVKAINIFKNTSLRVRSSSGFSLQKALIVFQFVIALVFIISAVIVGRQLQYAVTTDMGFNKDAVVLINIPTKYVFDKKYENKQFPLLAELKAIPGIQNISLGSEPMTDGYSSSQYEYQEDGKAPVKRQVYKKWIDTAYLNLYGIKLLAGRNLLASDTTNEFVINETAVKAFGFTSPEDAVGKYIGQPGQKFPIPGIVKDFHMQNFYTSIDPMAFEADKGNLFTFNIKLGTDASAWQQTLKAIEKKWYQFYPPETFSYKFYDETIEQMYQQERHLAILINLATAISIFISCLGLFGLAVLTVFQRTKEIGIRKVLGASVSGIVQLLSKEYVVLVIIAIVISSPVAWWLMNKWLQKFAYRIPVQWWMFAVSGFVAVFIALVTVSTQAIKAAIANPVKSLRTE